MLSMFSFADGEINKKLNRQSGFHLRNKLSSTYSGDKRLHVCIKVEFSLWLIAGICVWGLVRLQLGSVLASGITADCVFRVNDQLQIISCRSHGRC